MAVFAARKEHGPLMAGRPTGPAGIECVDPVPGHEQYSIRQSLRDKKFKRVVSDARAGIPGN